MEQLPFYQAKVNNYLKALLEETPASALVLQEALLYSTLTTGKRFRPYLVYSSAHIYDIEEEAATVVAAAIELIHCYSLVHDDLPSMDDSPLRHGRPSCHKAFGEGIAVLVGDSLLPLAFEIIARSCHILPQAKVQLIIRLAEAAGKCGMAGGQALDLIKDKADYKDHDLKVLHQLKTGELLAFSAEAGAILANAPEQERHFLRDYGYNLGLLYQVVDDLLDHESSTEILGKPTGHDYALNKTTILSYMLPAEARRYGEQLASQAREAIHYFDDKAFLLEQAINFVLSRKS